MSQFTWDDENDDTAGADHGGRSAANTPLEAMSVQAEPNSRRTAGDGIGSMEEFRVTEEFRFAGGGMEVASGMKLEDGDPSPPVDSANATQEQPQPGPSSAAPTLSMSEEFEPWRHDLTELGDARRLKDAYEPNVRWVEEKKAWIVYAAGRWHPDKTGSILQRGARQMVDFMKDQVGTEERQARTRAKERRKRAEELTRGLTNHHTRKSGADNADLMRQFGELLNDTGNTANDGSVPGSGHQAYVKKNQSRHWLQNIVTLLQAEPGISVEAAELDKNPDLLGVANGVVDLRTGHLRAAGRDDLITRTTATLYDPDAAAPHWERFLEDVHPDPEVRAFLGRAAGYSLTGHTREQCFFVLHGPGSTGKTTFIETLGLVLGDYAVGLPVSSLIAKTQYNIPNDIARLAGARFVPAAETNEFQRVDEALIKRLTGGDMIVARFLNQEYFSFPPTHKIWIATNHLPQVQDTGNGLWRRVVLIPFDQAFTGDADDKELKHKLAAEAPGILAWIVRHNLEWQRQGLDTPSCLVQAVKEYQADQDVVARFIAECCDVGDKTFPVPADSLYQAFQKWANVQGEHGLTGTAFGLRLNELGYDKIRTSRGSSRRGLKIV